MVMYSSEDLERFYLDYQSEWVPRGMTLQAYCSRNNVPYKVMENYSRNIQKMIGGESGGSSYGRASAECCIISVICPATKRAVVQAGA